MLRYIFKRLVGSLLTILCITTFCFFMIRIAPGGPFDEEKAIPPDIKRNIEKKYHLDEPLPKQYLRYVKGVFLHLDLGPSYKYPGRDVNEFIEAGVPKTLQLGFGALIVALCLGVGMGLTAALRQNTRIDYFAMAFAMIGVSIPSFVMAPLMQLFFSLKLKLFPVAGWESFHHMILPCLALGTLYAATIARLTRGGMLEVVRQDYIRAARAKGLKERTVVIRHMLRGGLLPIVSYLGPACASLLTGSLVIEKIFDIPGIGRHFVNSALNRDYTMTMGMVIFYASLLLLFNLIVDIAYTFLDPRIRYD
ncbi:MAG: hypothetical protein A3I05_00505 [Deltaproteobacteria bacterium RIFCSPLOWO2_02_FULL_44_10]|nr:MAG: hypothetical protein A3C46_01375 [Deltaproteobacteria bacterium RIFCSPHIGHO2_02_FULL_44_16]OGQ47284.1 MAG: hypothetical protein A3I05_00505 [Deltaproteobacteria bacterium RIFCSPLOWO2_02_FULL_44_10]